MSSNTPSSKYLPGELIDRRYKVVRLLGTGGMAEVYLVEDCEMHNRLVALKLLYSHISVDQVIVERFIREVELTQKHSHPNILRAYHYGKTERGEQYFTMEYIEGKSLAQLLVERGKIEAKEALFYILQAAQALSAAHKLGIIHRDIKPDNIMLSSDGVIKVTDFGIAKDLTSSLKLTELEKGPKSYAYKAPELYVEEYDHRVDIYSLGITAFELLSGKLPFEGERHQLLVAHLTAPIPKFAGGQSGIPKWCQELVEICAAKKPAERFESADELIDFIKAKAEGAISVTPKRFRKRTAILSAILTKYALAAALSVVLFVLYVPYGKSLSSTIIGDSLDLKLLDRFFIFRGAVSPPENIIIVSIDEMSYQAYGFSNLKPWPRIKIAELLEVMAPYTPRAVILDYLYSEPAVEEWGGRQTDERFAAALQSVPSFLAKVLNTQAIQQNFALTGELKPIWLEPMEIFTKRAKGTFAANVTDTGVVRRFNHDAGSNNGIPPIAEVLYGANASEELLPYRQDLINYYGPPGTIKNIPFHKALGGGINPDLFRDKIILVGQLLYLGYEVRQRDTFMTPFGQYSSGVEIHATSAGNFLRKDWIRRLHYPAELIILTALGFLFSYLILSTSPIFGLAVCLVGLPIWIGLSYAMFTFYLFFPGLMLFIILMPLAYFVSIVKVYLHKKLTDKILGIR